MALSEVFKRFFSWKEKDAFSRLEEPYVQHTDTFIRSGSKVDVQFGGELTTVEIITLYKYPSKDMYLIKYKVGNAIMEEELDAFRDRVNSARTLRRLESEREEIEELEL